MNGKTKANKARAVHGHAGRGAWTRTYTAWYSMKQRCLNPKTVGWERYGGRGIAVCERWLVFSNFLADMGEAPSVKHSLDRIDNNRNYEPGNCRWATKAEQDNNRSSNVKVTIDGKTHNIKEWALLAGIQYPTLYRRLVIARWDPKRAISTPVRSGISNL